MQSVRDYSMDMRTAHARPQPREERLRIPGQPQQTQMRMRSQPNLRSMARRPLPGVGSQAEHHEAYRTPRVVQPPTNTHQRRKHEAMYLEEPPFERPFSPESDSEEHMILDYYLQASYHSPLSRVVSAEEPCNLDGAIAGFDFGLEQPSEPSYTLSQPTAQRPRTAHGTKNALSPSRIPSPRRQSPSSPQRRSPPSPQRQVPSSPQRHVPSSPQRHVPSSPQRQCPTSPQRHSLSSPQRQPHLQYTLFPKEQQQPSTPRISVISDNGSITSHHSYNSHESQPRPRTSSLASSERSRSDSCMSVRLQPSATFTSSSPTSPKRPQTSPRMRTTSASSQQQTSLSEKPPSRWSGETVDMSNAMESPISARNAVDRTRDSSSSTLVATSPAWPTGSFFEDDEEEKLPLRRKVAQKLRSSRSSNALRSASNPVANVEQTHKKSPSWARRLVTWHR
ncbi:hypothetical protein AUEXF2481DRAFT_27939 [Aureobasidium subglaciale EXF-2481]|uniref:Uncharacterized protein n=1 Tax=Aureobasidium subglaciale (strain EXF-2481) TaxID=1043005 RepID=A0A074YRS2_AURSE|nr:uncharacterized protein AUEXF2481DRAFT_27939 [Aureobasidium subglaciale EXF-2481]KAI5209294.1 hypothetical protein E4T38_02449 [Aureobasidium subglaciale]KAI5228040.1 hypothetical protein E4T40_02228 [Aureobasidium subglaciale]KAI5231489.1 hypothetical protein E4T41_02448 [Aureobasidium subglaciale]KAI5265461.1 hypothetical protein E4T46_02226 [Aureobasidium subglaciale]KEQ96807.1 hypothetical protein AUEXF2481DRAFT_27939 [Aureobasidium subglaciale EXF-2481]